MPNPPRVGTLQSGSEIRAEMANLLQKSNEILVLSAFLTMPGIAWLAEHEKLEKVRLVVRAAPADVACGACDLQAVRRGLDLGWDVRFISNLHAKVYLVGDCVVIGSANLTANGLALFGAGNLELNTIIPASSGANELLNSIFDQAQRFDEDLIARMKSFVGKSPEVKHSDSWWPETVVPARSGPIFCNDLPIRQELNSNVFFNAPWSTIQRQLESGHEDVAKQTLESAFAYRWLIKALEANDGELYFGELTSILHDDLADDPAPYRSDVKALLANLLETIENTPGIGVEITRPRHSQRVRLLT